VSANGCEGGLIADWLAGGNVALGGDLVPSVALGTGKKEQEGSMMHVAREDVLFPCL
jgi:hypothetical protein